MKIVSIEPTPNPNSMKLNLDESLPAGVKLSYTKENHQHAPDYIKRLLQVEGVKSIYQVADFLALERNPKADWQSVLANAHNALELEGPDTDTQSAQMSTATADESYGEVNLYVQMFRGIPMQVKVLTGTEDIRVALPDRFKLAAKRAASTTDNFLGERKWEEKGVRYGDPQAIGEEMAQIIAAAYDEERLEKLTEQAIQQGPGDPVEESLSVDEVGGRLKNPDWKQRYVALEHLNLSQEAIPLLLKVLEDPNSSIRRLATVYLGTLEGPEILPALFRALKDQSVAVRRAAGDCLSDLGDPAAIGPMTDALKDSSKIVRWRAARFLFEVGDKSALPALKAAEGDPEFEVNLQIRMALARIEGGQEAKGPLWQQLAKGLSE